MTRALVAMAAVSLWLACSGAETTSASSDADDAWAAHTAALARFQRLNRPDMAGESLECLEVCQASDATCASADQLCEDADPRCLDARQSCSQTLALTPRACRHCLAYEPGS